MPFVGVARSTIHAFKYRGVTGASGILADWIHQSWQLVGLPFDVAVPIPLHPVREAERGFNQAELLLRQLHERYGWPVEFDGLLRQRATVAQIDLSAEQRRRNVADAFVASAAHVKGRRLLLLDDVVTTGATLNAAAQALQQAGADSVVAVCAAYATSDSVK